LLGLAIFLFPIVTNYLNNTVHYTVIKDYKDNVNGLDKKEIERKKKEAKAYNQTLTEHVTKIEDPFSNDNEDKLSEYESIINVGQAMAYVDIPKIDVELPIYKGVSDTILSKGIGHIPSSSLPVGGTGTHAALTAHRGLPTATLFRHLDKLDIG